MSYEAHEWFMNNWAWGNLGQRRRFDNAGKHNEDFVKDFSTRTNGCNNCPLGCKVNILLSEGEYSSVKCQSWFSFIFAVKTRDLLFNARCINLCEKYGLDTVSTACNIAFAIDLFKRGISRKDDIKIPERFFRETPSPPDIKLDHKKFNTMISNYYKLRAGPIRESRGGENWKVWMSMMSGKNLNSVDIISEENKDNLSSKR